ncbi:MAG: hypothetical protein IH827_00795, partial [Myxococcales bacterium]|nr:hypothetical protein [Myxococcales bacterium]
MAAGDRSRAALEQLKTTRDRVRDQKTGRGEATSAPDQPPPDARARFDAGDARAGPPAGDLHQELGGAKTHSEKSGVCHFKAFSEQDCFRQVRELLSFLPQNRDEKPALIANPDPIRRETPLLEAMCEVDPRKPYRVHHIIWQIADEHKFLEVMHDFANNIVVGFVRLGGDVVGVVANNPAHKAGA